MLTHEQRKRAAKEARKLASECVEGAAPKMMKHDFDRCPCAVVARRARIVRVASGAHTHASYNILVDLRDVQAAAWEVARGFDARGPRGVVFPLLALADALEADHG